MFRIFFFCSLDNCFHNKFVFIISTLFLIISGISKMPVKHILLTLLDNPKGKVNVEKVLTKKR